EEGARDEGKTMRRSHQYVDLIKQRRKEKYKRQVARTYEVQWRRRQQTKTNSTKWEITVISVFEINVAGRVRHVRRLLKKKF
ncbi:hypothetical protein U1Q18_052188, partial [Sarracenia purpurea var. burkii]